MAKNIQDLFNHIQEKKREQRQINAGVRDALAASAEYKEVLEGMERLRNKKRQIEMAIKDTVEEKLDLLKLDIKGGIQALSDAVLTRMLQGEGVEVVDHNNVPHDPVLSVRFQKRQ